MFKSNQIKEIILKWFIFTLIVLTTGCRQENITSEGTNLEINESEPTNSSIHSDRIKNASLLIRIESIQPNSVSFGFEMATLVQYQGQLYLITHNHYGDMLQNMNIVQLRDAQNHKIRSLYGSEFKSLIVYQDPGTLVLRAPDGLTEALTPVNVDHLPQVQPGDIVQVAYRGGAKRETVEILNAVIEEITVSGVTPVYRLRCLDGKLLSPGDSGGGIWYGETLVGNTWSILVTQTTQASSGTSEPAGEMQTDLSNAAVFPEMFR